MSLLREFDLGTEAGGRDAHLDRCFTHALKGVAAGFGGWTFVDEIAEDGCSCKDGEVDIVKSLSAVSYKW